MGVRAGLDGRKISPQRGIRSQDRPARSSVAIQTELPGPQFIERYLIISTYKMARNFPDEMEGTVWEGSRNTAAAFLWGKWGGGEPTCVKMK